VPPIVTYRFGSLDGFDYQVASPHSFCTREMSNEPETDIALPNVALRAYQLWEAAGRPEGRDEEFYFQAEEELRRLLDVDTVKPSDH
jgi:hypothetical protein